MLQFAPTVQFRRKENAFLLMFSLVILIAAFETPRPVYGGLVEVATAGEKEDDDKRMWGTSSSAAAAAAAATPGSTSTMASATREAESEEDVVSKAANDGGNINNSDSSSSRDNDHNNNGSTSSPTIPFVAKTSSTGAASSTTSSSSGGTTTSPPATAIPHQQKHNEHYYDLPLQGFQLTSRVYTDPVDKLAHFDNDISSQLVLPYWECGVSGSTTAQIPAQHVTVRHLLAGSNPNRYIGTEYGPHPQLIVALTHIDIVLNSGQTQSFAPGDVVLMEDVVSDGHKIIATSSSKKRGAGPMTNSPLLDHHASGTSENPTVMIVTLSQTYHHVGKDKISLQQHTRPIEQQLRANPCKNLIPGQESLNAQFGDDNDENDNFVANALSSLRMPPLFSKQDPRAIRRTFLAIIGVSVSALIGDFFGKVAPLWLAVGVGGVCFVTGGTIAFVQVGDYCIEEYEMWSERRRLRLGDADSKDSYEKDVESEDTVIEPPIPFVGAL